jgi:predicted small lipoprotein YifL
MKQFLTLSLAVICIAAITGCGVKPSSLQGGDNHPRTYPDTRHDQK